MSSATLYRLSGISLCVGSLLVIIGIIPGLFSGNDQTSAIAVSGSLVRLIGAMLVALGLPGVYARQAKRSGILGLIGYICTFFWILMAMAFEPIIAFVLPFLAVKAPAVVHGSLPPGLFLFLIVDGLMLLVGGILLGIATLRAGISPRLVGLVLIVGALFNFVTNFLLPPIADVGTVIVLVGLIWLAVGVQSEQPVTTEAPLPPSGVRA